jgi:SPP1 gp7 family putative phage head morphogenesis protein
LDYNWVNQAALNFAKTSRYTQIKGITETTRNQVQQAITDWMREGSHLDALEARLEPIFGVKRAEMIAVTETTHAYAQGNMDAWESTGIVDSSMWMTGRDELVCPICGELDGTDIGIGDIDAAPPAHPNCRCWLQPHVSEDMVNQRLAEILGYKAAIDKYYSDDEPRDEHGRWTSDGGDENTGNDKSAESHEYNTMMELAQSTSMSQIQAAEKDSMRKANEAGKSFSDRGYIDMRTAINDDDVYNGMNGLDNNEMAAFEAGVMGKDWNPEFVTAWRVGDVPADGRSKNYADDRMEPGLSVMETSNGLRTQDEFSKMFIMSKNRPVVYVSGFVHPYRKGSDSEPLLIQVKVLKKEESK